MNGPTNGARMPLPYLDGDGDAETVARRRAVSLSRARKTVERLQAGQGNPLSTDFLIQSYRHDTLDDYWRRQSINDKYDRAIVPTVHFGGWYDHFERGGLMNYMGMRGNPNAGPQMLVMGPWFHALVEDPELKRIEEVWIAYWVRGERNDVLERAPVRIFVVGANPAAEGPQQGRWRLGQEWPLARVQYTHYYLSGARSGAAGSLNDGTLTTQRPQGDDTPDLLEYDPDREELPGSIGFRSLAVGANNAGSDQRADEASGQMLTYTTAPLEQDVEVTGPITVELYASSTARDQVWVAHLTDVFPDGVSWLRTDGLLKASHRRSHSEPSR